MHNVPFKLYIDKATCYIMHDCTCHILSHLVPIIIMNSSMKVPIMNGHCNY